MALNPKKQYFEQSVAIAGFTLGTDSNFYNFRENLFYSLTSLNLNNCNAILKSGFKYNKLANRETLPINKSKLMAGICWYQSNLNQN
ncbi:MAG: hypothetical protein ACKO1W_16430 [Microcystaceae cyanobacterium]